MTTFLKFNRLRKKYQFINLSNITNNIEIYKANAKYKLR